MDEKWNVFVEGDVLFMHRSWTGHGVYEVSFAPAAGRWEGVASAVVEADGERYRSMGDEYDCLMMELIISAIVLGEPAAELRAGLVELTARASGKSDLSLGCGGAQRSGIALWIVGSAARRVLSQPWAV